MDFSDYRWKKRLLFIFSPKKDSEVFQKLQEDIVAQRPEIEDRHMVVFEIFDRGQSRRDGNPLDRQAALSIRSRFAIPSHKFCVILVGKDGSVKLQRDEPVKLFEIFQLIDSMPMRQNEMRKGKRQQPSRN